jgi:hypothetical protein
MPKFKVSRFHHTDLKCAADNNPACKKIFDRIEKEC